MYVCALFYGFVMALYGVSFVVLERVFQPLSCKWSFTPYYVRPSLRFRGRPHIAVTLGLCLILALLRRLLSANDGKWILLGKKLHHRHFTLTD